VESNVLSLDALKVDILRLANFSLEVFKLDIGVEIPYLGGRPARRDWGPLSGRLMLG
jgi:hypothetical protein